MRWTVTGTLKNVGGDASVTWDDGKITGDEFAVEKLQGVAAAYREYMVEDQSILGWVSPPGDHLANPIGAWTLLRDEVFEPFTMKHEGDSHIPDELKLKDDPNVVN